MAEHLEKRAELYIDDGQIEGTAEARARQQEACLFREAVERGVEGGGFDGGRVDVGAERPPRSAAYRNEREHARAGADVEQRAVWHRAVVSLDRARGQARGRVITVA